MIGSTEETDVGVVSLSDRRRIRDLENQTADLERKLAAALKGIQPGLERERGGDCLHQGAFIVSDNTLEVTCKRCDAKMDPYDVLRKIAHRETNFCYTLTSLRQEREQLAGEVEKLKTARSRIRRRVRKADDIPPAGVADLVRRHKLRAIGIENTGVGYFAVAVRSKDDRTITEGKDAEEALALLVVELEAKATVTGMM